MAGMSQQVKAKEEDAPQPASAPSFMGVTLPRSITNSAAVCGMFQLVAFLAQNMLQEYAFGYGDTHGIKLGWAYAFCELALCALIPMLELVGSSRGRSVLGGILKVKSMFLYAGMAGLLLMSTGVANVALEHLSISTLVVFKSAKLAPVMAVGWLGFGKTFTRTELIAAALLIVGVMNFVSADRWMDGQIRFSMYGCCLACLALLGDALYPNVQEKMMKSTEICSDTNSAQQQMLVATNLVGALFSLAAIVARDDSSTLVTFFKEQPYFFGLLLFHGFLQYFGLYFYLLLIQRYSPRTAVLWATIRKGATVLVYLVLRGHSGFHAMYALGAACMIAGMLVEKKMLRLC